MREPNPPDKRFTNNLPLRRPTSIDRGRALAAIRNAAAISPVGTPAECAKSLAVPSGMMPREHPSGNPATWAVAKTSLIVPSPPPATMQINFSSASFSDGFAGQSCSIIGFPSDPHFHNVTVLAQCANGHSQSRIAGCLAVQNNADGCHAFRPGVQELIKFSLGSNLLVAAPLYFIIRQSRPRHAESY